jgi:hypothetical protein
MFESTLIMNALKFINEPVLQKFKVLIIVFFYCLTNA